MGQSLGAAHHYSGEGHWLRAIEAKRLRQERATSQWTVLRGHRNRGGGSQIDKGKEQRALVGQSSEGWEASQQALGRVGDRGLMNLEGPWKRTWRRTA